MNAIARTWLGAALIVLAVHSSAQVDPIASATPGVTPPVTTTFFGQHFHRLLPVRDQRAVPTVWPSIVIGHLRLWDSNTRWADLEYQPGRWDFARLDAYVTAARTRQAEVIYTLGSPPRWASARPDEPCSYGWGCSAEPARMADWENYVRTIARRYRGRIQAYELWNEPGFAELERDRRHPHFFTGSVATMVELARIARAVLDAEDPQAVLTTPGFVNGPDRLEMFLAAGGARHVQTVAYHFYASTAVQLAEQVVAVRAVMRRQGVGHLPMWSTEAGVETTLPGEPEPQGYTRPVPARATALRAQFLLLGAAAGLERYTYYAWDNERSGFVTLFGDARPGAEAFRTAQAWMLNTRMVGCAQLPRRGVRCDGLRDGVRFIWLWADEAGTQTLGLPAGWALLGVEPLTGTAPPHVTDEGSVSLMLNEQPVLLKLRALSAAALKEAGP